MRSTGIAGITATTTHASGTLSWSAGTWADITPPGATGWTVYELAFGGVPYGIPAETDRVWVTDQIFQQLVRVTLGLAAPQVAIQIPGGTTDVQLAWSPVASATQYWVWYSELPYFAPGGTPAQEGPATTFTRNGVAADPAYNYYYVVRAVDAGGAESADSNRTGKFTFALTPGS